MSAIENVKAGDWLVTNKGECYQVTSVTVEAVHLGKYGQVFRDGSVYFGGRRTATARPATEADLTAFRERNEKRAVEAAAERERWDRDELARSNAGKLLAACELFLKFDGENCQTGPTHYDDVKAAILDAVRSAAPYSEYAK